MNESNKIRFVSDYFEEEKTDGWIVVERFVTFVTAVSIVLVA